MTTINRLFLTCRWFRRGISTTFPTNSLTDVNVFRRDTLQLLEKWDSSFTTQSLSDITASFIRRGDLPLATKLLCSIGLECPGFDTDNALYSYLIVETMQSNPDKAVALVKFVMSKYNRIPAEFVLEAIFDRICENADWRSLESLEAIPWTLFRLEKAISRVYLRSNHTPGILKLLRVAQNKKLNLSDALWQEVFEVLLQPPTTTECASLSKSVLMLSDHDFQKLEDFLLCMTKDSIKLPKEAIDALERVLSKTIVPTEFFEFLEKYPSK